MTAMADEQTMAAGDLMTRDVLTVAEEMTLQELAAFFRDHRITGAPVVGPEGGVVGVVSLVDLARADSERSDAVWDPLASDYYVRNWKPGIDHGVQIFHVGDHRLRVRDIMNREVYSVAPETGVAEIAGEMLRHHIHRLLVIDGGELVGVLTTSDLLGLLAGGRQT